MPRKRRKLNKELENQIAVSTKKVELVIAKINDIADDDIQLEYRAAFDPAKNTLLLLTSLYTTEGFTEQTQSLMSKFTELIHNFENEYEI